MNNRSSRFVRLLIFINCQQFSLIININKFAIGHFRVPCASVSRRVQVQNLSYENQFYSQVHSNVNQTHFHMKGFADGLVLKQRQTATQKWPIGININ